MFNNFIETAKFFMNFFCAMDYFMCIFKPTLKLYAHIAYFHSCIFAYFGNVKWKKKVDFQILFLGYWLKEIKNSNFKRFYFYCIEYRKSFFLDLPCFFWKILIIGYFYICFKDCESFWNLVFVLYKFH